MPLLRSIIWFYDIYSYIDFLKLFKLFLRSFSLFRLPSVHPVVCRSSRQCTLYKFQTVSLWFLLNALYYFFPVKFLHLSYVLLISPNYVGKITFTSLHILSLFVKILSTIYCHIGNQELVWTCDSFYHKYSLYTHIFVCVCAFVHVCCTLDVFHVYINFINQSSRIKNSISFSFTLYFFLS